MRTIGRLAAASLVVAVAGCFFGDPWRSYNVPGWTRSHGKQTSYEQWIDPGVTVRVDNHGFGGSFSVTADIFNVSSEGLSFDGSPMYVVDRQGNRLPPEIAGELQCDYSPRPPVTVPPQGHIEARCGFRADLRKLPSNMTLIQKGLSLPSRAIPLEIPMID